MAIQKQNRALVFIFIFILFVLALIFYQSRNLFFDRNLSDQVTNEIIQEKMAINEKQIPFLQILKNMGDCLQIPVSTANGLNPNIESFLLVLQPTLGPQTAKDKSLYWHLRGRDGLEKKLFLNLLTDDSGKLYKQVDYFAVDGKGTEVRLEIDPEKSKNPTDEYINSFLKDVEVLQKLKTSTVEFTNGARIELQEQDSEIMNIEISHNKNIFICKNLKSSDACQCQQ